MEKVIVVYKPVGYTPLEIIRELKKGKYRDSILGYAGRLDPMAEGLLLILVDDENHKRPEYERLKKQYEFEVLVGISTDSYDIMGKIKDTSFDYSHNEIIKKIKNLIPSYIGRCIQEYPPYSSPRVNGKPLFFWAREERINEIEIPKKVIEIYSLTLISNRIISITDLVIDAEKRISMVHGEFRQKEIIEGWKRLRENNPATNFLVLKFIADCSSGTYIRSLSNQIGLDLQLPAFALTIKRTMIGTYIMSNTVFNILPRE